MSYGKDDYYLCDGVYGAPWTWPDDDEFSLDDEELSSKENTEVEINLRTQWMESLDSPRYSLDDYLNALFKATIHKGLYLASSRYCRVEKIPSDYAFAICKNCSISELIISDLSGYRLFQSMGDIKRLDLFIEELVRKRDKISVYFKVSEIQLFIHREMQIKHGERSHLSMDREIMRVLLSIMRLYFLVNETREMSFGGFIELMKNYNEKIGQVKSYCPDYVIDSGRQYNTNWSARHQHSLLYYLPEVMRIFVKNLMRQQFSSSKSDVIKALQDSVTKYHLT
ncbi:hypothetical protein QWY77_12660 [Thalassotalea ponticola]|uniref:hypothetical protein n=1 Tax=Thalassotalea ponticola TaxID=1523392 RepID=UPI0025B3BD35|nr:hypothetical protein [Thalassotalea ponticola]MDN3653596.1 hypothetical protein [Thalassotalea ponticola]